MTPSLIALLTASLAPSSAGWLSGWDDNLRWSIDESVRVVQPRTGDSTVFGFLGLDIHKVITGDRGDIATLTLQPYLTHIDHFPGHPPMFDGPDDWELVWRIFNANFKLTQTGSANLKVGHFEIPFGLEHVINTNGTLRDYVHGPQFGLKADWGVSVNGALDAVEYELAWSRGSGNEYRDEGDPGVISGRIATPQDENNVYGLSFVDGDFRTPSGILERDRIGVDAQWYRESLGYFAELSTGSDADTDVLRFLGEVNWRNSDETVMSWLQLVVTDLDDGISPADAIDSKVGVRWLPAGGWSLSLQYTQNLEPMVDTAHRAGSVAVQLRYRF